MAQSVIGALRVNLGLDSAQFMRGAQQARSTVDQLGRRMQQVGAAVSAVGVGIAVAIRGQINAMDDLAKVADRIGMPVEALSQLEHAANLSGVSIQTMQGALQRMSREMVNNSNRFAQLGINVRDAAGNMRPTADVLEEVADVLAGMPEGAERTALAIELLGRSGAELIPMLRGGGDGLRAMRNEADRLGLTISTQTARQAEQLNDNLTRLQAQIAGLVRQISTAFIPVLERLSNAIVEISQNFAGMSAEQQQFAAAIAGITIVAGPALIAIGSLIRALGLLRVALVAAAGPWGILAAAIVAAGIAIFNYQRDAQGAPGTMASVESAQLALNRALDTFASNRAPQAGANAIAYARNLETQALATIAAAEAQVALNEQMIAGMSFPGVDPALNPAIGRAQGDLAAARRTIADATSALDNARRTAQGLSIEMQNAGDATSETAREALRLTIETDALEDALGRAASAAGGAARVQMPELADAMEQVNAATKQVESSFESAFVDFVTGAKSAQDAIASLLRDLARLAAQAAFRRLFGVGSGGGGIIGAISGALFPGSGVKSYEGGGFTGSGPRTGGLDGRGGMLAMVHPNETVIDHTRGGGGGVTVNIDARGAVEGVAVQIEAAIQRRLPEILQASSGYAGDRRLRGFGA